MVFDMYEDILSNLVITKVRSVSTMYNPENSKSKNQNRARWAIVLKYEGETVYTASGKAIVSNPSHMVILPHGCSYEWLCRRAGHYSIVEFDAELMHPEPLSFYVKNHERFLNIFKSMEYQRNLKKPLAEQESIRDTYTLLLMLAQTEREAYLPTEKQQKIAPALDYISQNYDKPVTNEALAEMTGMSTVYFRKLFTEIMGISPIAYVHELRIRKAKEMLRSDHGTLTDVALSLGYANLYDFSRDFKRHTGVAPSQYETTW